MTYEEIRKEYGTAIAIVENKEEVLLELVDEDGSVIDGVTIDFTDLTYATSEQISNLIEIYSKYILTEKGWEACDEYYYRTYGEILKDCLNDIESRYAEEYVGHEEGSIISIALDEYYEIYLDQILTENVEDTISEYYVELDTPFETLYRRID